MARPNDGRNAADAIARVKFPFTVSRWSDVSDLIEYFSYFAGTDWLFRGEASRDFDLVPSVGRDTRKAKPTKRSPKRRVGYSLRDEKAVFEMFVQQARAHVNSMYTPLEWLAIAQHFGVPTRLLDWTDSFLVAVWFATHRTVTGADSRVWVTCDTLPVDPGAVDPFAIETPRVYRPPHISPRIAAQGSVLMVCPEPLKPPALQRRDEIIITPGVHFELRKRLNACGLNQRTLFPDLQGLGSHLAWLYKNDWLAGYRTSVFAILLNTGSFKSVPPLVPKSGDRM